MIKKASGITILYTLSMILAVGCDSEPYPVKGVDTTVRSKCEDSGGSFTNDTCVCGSNICPKGVACTNDGKACDKDNAFEQLCTASGGTYEGKRCKCADAICDDGAVCNAKTKKCPESQIGGPCNNDDTACSNGQMYKCVENKWEEEETCSNGCHSDQKRCAECKEDGCKDGRPFTCNNGTIVAGAPCKNGKCTEDGSKCEAVCTTGEISCFDSKVQTCSDDTWNITETCPAGCAGDKKSCAKTCTDGAMICADGTIKTCNGNVYDAGNPCDNGASCKSETECGECANESKQCIDDENKIGKTRTCVAGVWKDDVSQCDDVSCDIVTNGCGECKNESKQCIDDENEIGKPRTCIAGVWKDDANQCDDVSCDVVTNECGECKNHSNNICKNDEDTQAGHLETCVAGKIVLGDKCQNNNGSLKYSCEGESEMTVCGTCLNDKKVCEKRGGDDRFWVYLCTHGEWKKQYRCPDGCNEQTNECN